MVAVYSDKMHLISLKLYYTYVCAHVAFDYEFQYAGLFFRVFFIALYHVHIKEDYMRKRLIVFPANRPLHLLNLNYVVWLFL